MLQISLIATLESLVVLEKILLDCGALSVTLQDAADSPELESDWSTSGLWPQMRISALFDGQADAQQIRAKLSLAVQADTVIRISELRDQDWVRGWMESYQPMSFGQRLWICPSWKPCPEPDATVVTLDPGMAFGTGTHPTTALCLEWLASQPLDNHKVVDFGCGSGILAIAAIRLGARHAWAVDIDPKALTVTRENAKKNNINPNSISTAPPDSLPQMKADLVIANILSGPLLDLTPVLANMTRPGGKIILSGILIDQALEVANKYTDFFTMGSPKTKEGWALIEGERKAK